MRLLPELALFGHGARSDQSRLCALERTWMPFEDRRGAPRLAAELIDSAQF
jgi:hypothetical protein